MHSSLTNNRNRPAYAFTLLELMLVIAIIAMLASLALPHGTGLTKSNNMTAASRQLLDDLAFARQKALSTRSPVYVVFISPYIAKSAFIVNLRGESARKQATNMIAYQYTTYALYSPRTVGDQPGNDHPRYLTSWKTLPEGVFIAKKKFSGYDRTADPTNRAFVVNSKRTFPYPTVTDNNPVPLPYICFDSQGRLVSDDVSNGMGAPVYDDTCIPLARGSIFYPRQNGMLMPYSQYENADIVETPKNNSIDNYNRIRISWVTGRAKLERLEIK